MPLTDFAPEGVRPVGDDGAPAWAGPTRSAVATKAMRAMRNGVRGRGDRRLRDTGPPGRIGDRATVGARTPTSRENQEIAPSGLPPQRRQSTPTENADSRSCLE